MVANGSLKNYWTAKLRRKWLPGCHCQEWILRSKGRRAYGVRLSKESTCQGDKEARVFHCQGWDNKVVNALDSDVWLIRLVRFSIHFYIRLGQRFLWAKTFVSISLILDSMPEHVSDLRSEKRLMRWMFFVWWSRGEKSVVELATDHQQHSSRLTGTWKPIDKAC